MNKVRNLVADILVGIVLIIVVWWVLRGILGWLLWVVNVIAIVLVIGALLWLAGRIRGR